MIEHRNRIPAALWPVVIDRAALTVAEITAAVRAAGAPIKATVSAIRAARDDLDRLRRAKARPRPYRLPLILPNKERPGRGAHLPTGDLESRLLARTRAAFPARAMRYGAAGGDVYHFALTSDPAAVGWRTVISEDRNIYKGRWKGAAATVAVHHITLPRRWLRLVSRLDVVDDLPTLDAAPLISPVEGVELYAATWATQGRGYTVNTHRGYIARAGSRSYHGETVAAALAGLRRKAQLPAERDAAALDRLAARHGDKVVTPADAYAVGACVYGVANWCQRTGLADRESATVAEIVAAWRICPAPEAIAAIRRAVRA